MLTSTPAFARTAQWSRTLTSGAHKHLVPLPSPSPSPSPFAPFLYLVDLLYALYVF
jgi:hypothetical protein